MRYALFLSLSLIIQALGCRVANPSSLQNDPSRACVDWDMLKLHFSEPMTMMETQWNWFSKGQRSLLQQEFEQFRYVALDKPSAKRVKKLVAQQNLENSPWLHPLRFKKAVTIPLLKGEPLSLFRVIDLFELKALTSSDPLSDLKPLAFFYKHLTFLPKKEQSFQKALLDESMEALIPAFPYAEKLDGEDLVLIPVKEAQSELTTLITIKDQSYLPLGKGQINDLLGDAFPPAGQKLLLWPADFERNFGFTLHADLERSALVQNGLQWLESPIELAQSSRKRSQLETYFEIENEFGFDAPLIFSEQAENSLGLYVDVWDQPLKGGLMLKPSQGQSLEVALHTERRAGEEVSILDIQFTGPKKSMASRHLPFRVPEQGVILRKFLDPNQELYFGVSADESGPLYAESIPAAQWGASEIVVSRRVLNKKLFRYRLQLVTMRPRPPLGP